MLYSYGMLILLNMGAYITILMFGYHWGMGREFNYSKTITAFGFAGYLGYRIIPYIFQGVTVFLKFKVVWKRVSEVIEMDEFQVFENQNKLENNVIYWNNVDASWGFKVKKNIYSGEMKLSDKAYTDLKNITFTAKKSDLISIVGPVGSGKSTLLALIMGELQIQQGEIQTRGRMWYVEQEPYIISDSIKQNILFGLPFEEQRFESKLHNLNIVHILFIILSN